MMIIPRVKDAKHKNQLLKLLRAILKNNFLANQLVFKGGTYAALRGTLDRFSVDLDFDLPDKNKKEEILTQLNKIFQQLNLEIKDQSQNYIQFFLRYKAKPTKRNTLKLDVNDQPSRFNIYEKISLPEPNLYCRGHSLDTMFANKLVAAMSRFEKNGKIAGRDFYDLHRFFEQGLKINSAVIEERTGLKLKPYLQKLSVFIKQNVTQKLLREDINPLLSVKQMKQILPDLKSELLIMIQDEIKRLN